MLFPSIDRPCGKRLLTGSISVGLLCVSVASATAQEVPRPPARDTVRVDKNPLSRRSATENIVFGQIVNVDEHRLTIREGEGDAVTTTVYSLSPDFRIIFNGREIKLSDLPPSPRIRFQRGATDDAEISELYVVSDDDSDSREPQVRVTDSTSPVGFGLVLTEHADEITVVDVRKDSPAEQAGVHVGDEIVSLNDSVLLKPSDVFDATANMSVGDSATLTVRRNDQERKLSLRAAAGPAAVDSVRSESVTQDSVPPTRVVEDEDAPRASTELVPPVELGATLETTPDGLRIVRMNDVSPLGDAGVRAGDYIKTAAGESVLTPKGLFRVLNNFDGGAKVELTVMRGDDELDFTVTLPDDHEKVLVDTSANNAPRTTPDDVRIRGVRTSDSELLQQILANQQRQQQQLNVLAQAMQRLAQAAGVDGPGVGGFGFAGAFPFGNAAGGPDSNCYCAIGFNPQGNPVIGFTQDGTAVAVVSYDASGTPILAETTIAAQGSPDVTNDGLTSKDQNGDGLPDGPDLDGDGFPSAANANAGADSNCVCPIAIDINGNPVIGVTQRGIPVAVVSTDANGNPILAETTLQEQGNGAQQPQKTTGQPKEPVQKERPLPPTELRPAPGARKPAGASTPPGNSGTVTPRGSPESARPQ